MKRTTLYSRTLLFLLSAALISPPLLISSSHRSEARAGRGFSIGSRGSRTFNAPSYTRITPNGGQPFQRTMSRPPSSPPRGYNSPPNQGSTAVPPSSQRINPTNSASPQRGNFLKGVVGGVAGAAAYDMLMGHHQSNAQTPTGNTPTPPVDQRMEQAGQNSMQSTPTPNQNSYQQQANKKSNSSGTWVWIIILALLVWFGIRYFRKNSMNNDKNNNHSMNPLKEYIKESNIQLTQNDYTAFQQRLIEIQEAWNHQDLGALQKIATPEMVSYFNEQLTDLASKGLHNTTSNVQFEQGDLSEVWTEGTREYATVAMRYSLIDITTDSNGNVVEGNPNQPTTITELWTFVRSIDHNWWLLSAIQQQK